MYFVFLYVCKFVRLCFDDVDWSVWPANSSPKRLIMNVFNSPNFSSKIQAKNILLSNHKAGRQVRQSNAFQYLKYTNYYASGATLNLLICTHIMIISIVFIRLIIIIIAVIILIGHLHLVNKITIFAMEAVKLRRTSHFLPFGGIAPGCYCYMMPFTAQATRALQPLHTFHTARQSRTSSPRLDRFVWPM